MLDFQTLANNGSDLLSSKIVLSPLRSLELGYLGFAGLSKNMCSQKTQRMEKESPKIKKRNRVISMRLDNLPGAMHKLTQSQIHTNHNSNNVSKQKRDNSVNENKKNLYRELEHNSYYLENN